MARKYIPIDNQWIDYFFKPVAQSRYWSTRTYECQRCHKRIEICAAKDMTLKAVDHLKGKCVKLCKK